MMYYRKSLLVLAIITTLMASAVVPVTAHESQNIEGYEITFGGAEEPVITGERMWLQFEIVDNQTGEPVANQSENLIVSVQTEGSNKTALELSEKHGDPGVYEAPVIFTEPGITPFTSRVVSKIPRSIPTSKRKFTIILSLNIPATNLRPQTTVPNLQPMIRRPRKLVSGP